MVLRGRRQAQLREDARDVLLHRAERDEEPLPDRLASPGSYSGTHLVVTDIEAAREELVGRGVGVNEIRHMGPNGWEPGPDPERRDYGSFADFADPDGNTWVLQEARRGEQESS